MSVSFNFHCHSVATIIHKVGAFAVNLLHKSIIISCIHDFNRLINLAVKSDFFIYLYDGLVFLFIFFQVVICILYVRKMYIVLGSNIQNSQSTQKLRCCVLIISIYVYEMCASLSECMMCVVKLIYYCVYSEQTSLDGLD